MAFLEDPRLPVDVERHAVGGPRLKRTIIPLSSGFERRNQDWEQTLGTWDISYGLTSEANLEAVVDHWYATRTGIDGFRFKDWSDFQIGNTFSGDVSTRQQIGLGDDTTVNFQVFKRRTRGAVFFDRTIKKLVSGTLRVFLEGVEQNDPADYTVDLDTGIITFVTAPASTGGSGPGGEEVVAVMTEFDVPVRFQDDNLTIDTLVFAEDAKISIPRIPVVEIRV